MGEKASSLFPPWGYAQVCYLFSPTSYSRCSLSLYLFLLSQSTLSHMQKGFLISAPASDGPNQQSKLETWDDSSNRQVWESLMKVWWQWRRNASGSQAHSLCWIGHCEHAYGSVTYLLHAGLQLNNTCHPALQGRPEMMLGWKWGRNIHVCNQVQRYNQYIPEQPSTAGENFSLHSPEIFLS